MKRVAAALTVILFLPATVLGSYACGLCPPSVCEPGDRTCDGPAYTPPCQTGCSGNSSDPPLDTAPPPLEKRKPCDAKEDIECDTPVRCFQYCEPKTLTDFQMEQRWSNPTPGVTPGARPSVHRQAPETVTNYPSYPNLLHQSIPVTVLLC